MSDAQTSPLVSFCIPTYKRSRYLQSLLEGLTDQLAGFPYPFEVVIADNASPDSTESVVGSFMQALPIRYLRHARNIGGFPNFQYVMAQAAGRYVVYVADDDCLMGEQVAATIAKMEADPGIVVVYAPWILFDLISQQQVGQFYHVPHDLRIERNEHGQLLDHILRHHIFPEVQITRRDVLQRLMPRIHENAFFAFVHAADYLTQGAVLIQKTPYYAAITRYFADETRDQLGNDEVEVAWDRYRGGLEYLAARGSANVSAEERLGFNARVQQMIAVRMSVAIRIRHQKGRNPVDTYMLAMRLRGMGYESLCPVPLKTLASEASVHFLMSDVELNRGVRQLVCVGDLATPIKDYLRERTPHPIEFVISPPEASRLADTLVFLCGNTVRPVDYDQRFLARNCRSVTETELFDKYAIV